MEATPKVPDNFRSIITDFTKDLSITFPEYIFLWSKWTDTEEFNEKELQYIFEYCLSIYPERFFDILYQNDEIFKPESEINTIFLPSVDFKLLFHCEGVSETTKKTMWKYLQLILFTIVGGIKDKSTFGETLNLFEGVDEEQLNEKLKETMSGITDFFSNISENMDMNAETANTETETETGEKDSPQSPNLEHIFENMPGAKEFAKTFGKMDGLPNMENMQDHLKTLFDGKIGKLAKDMAEEITDEFKDFLGEDMQNTTDPNDMIKKLMKNPKKIMDLMKTVSGKLDSKMKSGEISKDEIMQEASELFGKMKDMGGTEQFAELFKNLTKSMGGMGKNMRMDTNAIDRMTKQQSTRERMLKKLEQRKREAALQNEMRSPPAPMNYSVSSGQQSTNLVFKVGGETQEKTYIHPDLLADMEKEESAKTNGNTNAPKKNKKKKNKK